MGRKVFHIAKLRSKIETNKQNHSKVAIFLLRVKNRISKEECSKKKEVLSSTEEGGEATFLRESKTGTKVPPKILSIIFVFSIYLFYNTVRCVFVCSFVRLFVCLFVCLFVKRAYAREETCAISSFAGTCTSPNSTKGRRREKTDKKHVQYLHLQELAHFLTAQKAEEERKPTKNVCNIFICRNLHTS